MVEGCREGPRKKCLDRGWFNPLSCVSAFTSDTSASVWRALPTAAPRPQLRPRPAPSGCAPAHTGRGTPDGQCATASAMARSKVTRSTRCSVHEPRSLRSVVGEPHLRALAVGRGVVESERQTTDCFRQRLCASSIPAPRAALKRATACSAGNTSSATSSASRGATVGQQPPLTQFGTCFQGSDRRASGTAFF